MECKASIPAVSVAKRRGILISPHHASPAHLHFFSLLPLQKGYRCHKTRERAADMLHFLSDLSYLPLDVVRLYGFMTWPHALWVTCWNKGRTIKGFCAWIINTIYFYCGATSPATFGYFFFGSTHLSAPFSSSLSISLWLSLCQISAWKGTISSAHKEEEVRGSD